MHGWNEHALMKERHVQNLVGFNPEMYEFEKQQSGSHMGKF